MNTCLSQKSKTLHKPRADHCVVLILTDSYSNRMLLIPSDSYPAHCPSPCLWEHVDGERQQRPRHWHTAGTIQSMVVAALEGTVLQSILYTRPTPAGPEGKCRVVGIRYLSSGDWMCPDRARKWCHSQGLQRSSIKVTVTVCPSVSFFQWH